MNSELQSLACRQTIVWSMFFAIATLGIAIAHAAEPMPNAVRHERQFVTSDGEQTVVRLPSSAGHIAKADLLAELGEVAGLNLRAIEWLLPDGQLDLNKPKTRQRLARINRILGRYVQTRIARDDNTSEPELVIEIDRARLRSDKRRAKTRAKSVSLRILDPRGTLRSRQRFGLAIDDSAARRPCDRLIVGIHGFNSGRTATDVFLDPLRDAGFPCASFVYPNDQPIADSAKLLSNELAALVRREPTRRVAIVAFSMGGLVARAAIEDPALDPGNVERLIMIAPPNQGTICARYARGADLYEHLYRERRFEPRGLLVASLLDGLGEARKDLCPNSPFLLELNARRRNERVRYSILLGEGKELDHAIVERFRSSIDKLERRSKLAQVFGPKLDGLREDLDELAEPSDGFVTVQRGRLEGVDDVELLRFGHVERFDDLENERVIALHQAIAGRLKSTP